MITIRELVTAALDGRTVTLTDPDSATPPAAAVNSWEDEPGTAQPWEAATYRVVFTLAGILAGGGRMGDDYLDEEITVEEAFADTRIIGVGPDQRFRVRLDGRVTRLCAWPGCRDYPIQAAVWCDDHTTTALAALSPVDPEAVPPCDDL